MAGFSLAAIRLPKVRASMFARAASLPVLRFFIACCAGADEFLALDREKVSWTSAEPVPSLAEVPTFPGAG